MLAADVYILRIQSSGLYKKIIKNAKERTSCKRGLLQQIKIQGGLGTAPGCCCLAVGETVVEYVAWWAVGGAVG